MKRKIIVGFICIVLVIVGIICTAKDKALKKNDTNEVQEEIGTADVATNEVVLRTITRAPLEAPAPAITKKIITPKIVDEVASTPTPTPTPTIEVMVEEETIEYEEEVVIEIIEEEDEVIIEEEIEIIDEEEYEYNEIEYTWDGSVITASSGVNYGPSGFETYYNLPMGGVIDIMRSIGYSEEDYPYWVRDDGAKMFGPYVMVAANLDLRPRGTVLECSLGMAIVCDTGGFAESNETQLDLAVSW